MGGQVAIGEREGRDGNGDDSHGYNGSWPPTWDGMKGGNWRARLSWRGRGRERRSEGPKWGGQA